VAELRDFEYIDLGGSSTACLVSELVIGQDLASWSQALRRIARTEAVKRRTTVAKKITQALDAAHKCSFVGDLGFQQVGVLHGDIKPGNILIRDKTDEPVVLDFMIPDIHRALGHPDSYWTKADGRYRHQAPLTGIFGTPGYMPPEQEVDGVVSVVSDIYALGRTFEELFWPEEPFSPQLDGDHPHRSCDRALRALTQWMTSPQPGERPDSMSVVNARLQDVDTTE
jgi:serine/threonine protein kinase